jgi:hypothetical protein
LDEYKSGDFVFVRSNEKYPYIGFIKDIDYENCLIQWFLRCEEIDNSFNDKNEVFCTK